MARVNADNKLLNYGLNEKEEAKASSGGFGNWFADLNQYIRAGGIIGGLAGMTKPLWYDKLSDEARQRLDNYVDRSTFLPRKMTEGMAKSVEGIVDTAALLGVMNTMPFSKDAREAVKEFTERDFVGEWYNRDAYKHRDDGLLKDDGLVAQGAQAVGGMLPSVIGAIATGGSSVVAQGATKLPQIVSLGTTAAGAMGNAAESAYQDGAGFGGGLAYGAAIGGIEAATEKLVGGGLDKVFGGGWLDDIIPIGDWAKTGVGRYAANAVGEGFEEMTSEAVDPLAKAIYKGKDAFADYDLGDHIKDIGKAGLMGAAISGIYGGAFDAMGGGVKQGDIQNVISDMESIREQSDKLKVKNNFTAEYGKKADSQTLGDLRIIEKTLKGVDENKRADLINKNGLSGLFETDGSLKADYAEALSKESEFDRRYFDEEYRAHESVIKSDLAELNSELEDRFGENAKKVSVYSGELTQKGKAAYTKLQRAQKIFNELSGRHNGIIVTDESPNFNGKLVGDSRIYISADTLESGAWAGTLVHENMHFAEGTEEYNRLVSLLEADTELEAKAVEAVMNKSGYGFDKAMLDIIGKRINAGENVEQGARLAYELYRSEISAHMGEAMLGTEAFINRVVRTDAPLAEKIIGKILDLKEAFGRIGDTEAQAQHKRLAEAERMYLDAIEAAGKRFEDGKIVSADDEDEEKEKTAESGGDIIWLSDSDLEAYMKEGKELHTRNKKDRLLKSGKKPILTTMQEIKNFISDVIKGNAIGEVRAFGKVGEGLAKAIMEKRNSLNLYGKYLEINADNLREAYKRHSNSKDPGDVPLSDSDFENIPEFLNNIDGVTSVDTHKGKTEVFLYKKVDDRYVRILTVVSTQRGSLIVDKLIGVSKEKFESKYKNKIKERDTGSPRGQTENSDDSNPSTKARHTAGALSTTIIPQNSEKSTPKGQFSFKEDSDNNKNVTANNENEASDNKKPTSYTKAEAVEMVDGIMESLLSFEWGYGELKNRASVIKQAHMMLNATASGKRISAAQRFADYLIEHIVLSEWVDPEVLAPYAEKLETLKPYLHKLNLDSLRGEITHHYDKDTSPLKRWGKRKGEIGYSVEQMASELKESGYEVSSKNPADIFFEIDRDYREALEALKKKTKSAVRENFSDKELAKLREDIARKVLEGFDERDFSIKRLKQISETSMRDAARLKAANDKLRAENAELSKEATRQTRIAEDAVAKKDAANEKAEKERERRIFSEEYNKHASTVVGLVERIGEWKKGVFESAADANGDVFKGIIGSLTSIKRGKQLLPVKTREAMKKLAEWYGAADIYPIVKDLKEGKVKLWDENAFSAMVAVGDAKAIEEQRPLTVEEVKNVELVLRHLKHITEIYHKAFKSGNYVSADELANGYLKIFKENSNVNVGRVKKLIDGKYYEYFGDAEALMKWHDRYNKNGFFTETFNELREGALNMAIAQMQMRAELDAWLDKNPNFLKKLNNTTIEVEGIEMTRAEALSLYMTARREQAEGGLAVSGFEIRSVKDGMKNSVDGLVEKEYLESGEYDLEKLQGVIGKFQRNLYSQFTESEKRYLNFVEKILNDDCKQRKIRTDNIRLGYSNTLEGFYYPIRRAHIAKEVGKTDESLGAELGRIRKLSFNQNTVIGSKGKLLIEPINNVVDRHIAGIAMYENVSIAIDNFNLIFNYDVSGNKNNPESIAKFIESKKDRDGNSIQNAWANGGEYIDKLIKDIEGINASDRYESKALGFIRSGFVKFQLGANPKTWVTQLSSLFASMSVLDPKYVGLAMKSKTRGKAFGAELDKYSALAKLRNSENTAALAQGVIDELGKVGDVLMRPIGATDRFVIKKLWYACQLQVEAEQKLKLGTEENKVAAAKLLEKVIFETQQNSLLTEKSAAMRSNSELIKGFTMFSSDAMKMTARIVDAYGRISVIKEKLKGAEGDVKKSLEAELKEATGEFKRASGSAVAVAAFMSLIALAFSHFYGKRDEEETFGEAAATFGADFAGNLLGGLPLVRDVYSYIADGYELNHYAISYVNDLLSGINGLFALTNAAFTGKRVTAQEVASKTKAALFGLGQVFGIPLRNAYNVGRGLVGGASLITGNGKSFGYAWDSFFYDKSYTADLNKAIEAGDDKLVSQISALMVGESFDGVDKSVSDELRRLIATGADVLPRAVGDSITYDGEEYAFTLRQRRRFDDIYGTADEALADMVKLKQYKLADDKAKAQAVRFLYDTYYQLAVDDMLGVDSMAKNVLFAEAIDIEKLAIIVAQARMFTADKDKKGNSINGTKKLKVLEFLESLSLNAAQKHMILGYLGYKQSVGEPKVTAYVSRLKLTSAEKKALMRYSGYAV